MFLAIGCVVGELQATTTEPEDGVHWFHQVRPTLIPEVDIDHAGWQVRRVLSSVVRCVMKGGGWCVVLAVLVGVEAIRPCFCHPHMLLPVQRMSMSRL